MALELRRVEQWLDGCIDVLEDVCAGHVRRGEFIHYVPLLTNGHVAPILEPTSANLC